MFKGLLEQQAGNLALVIGNGINRYDAPNDTNSWEGLLLALAEKHIGFTGSEMLAGMSLTEFYDIVDLNKAATSETKVKLQEEFCAAMRTWQPFPHHARIVAWAHKHKAPILTTNFDDLMARVGPYELQKLGSSFTDYYPWDRYYSDAQVERPDLGFGIWHINGMHCYRRSIRLGLSHYMGSVERARAWIHKGNERRLFSGQDPNRWGGAHTWLHIVISLPLIFFGLALEENEVFLRWLLIERARYFKKFPDRKKPAWYVYTSAKESAGKLFFLKGLGIETIKVGSYDDIYGADVWSDRTFSIAV